MTERSIKGDYIGFTFGGVHSSELGLLRVSDGSRYNSDLLPPLVDKKVQVAGRDGEVYFGSTYNSKTIKVSVAFDNMNELSWMKLINLLNDQKPKYLWFDETPYKQWLVKAASTENLKWICFDESNQGGDKRIYKGEGTLDFICFESYATSRVTFLDDVVDSIWVWDENHKCLVKQTTGNPTLMQNYNYYEWKDYSGLFPINTLTEDPDEQKLIIYNAGNKEQDFTIYWYGTEYPGDTIDLENYSTFQSIGSLVIDGFELKEGDVGIAIDSKLKLIKGIDNNQQATGNIYNEYITGGDFLKNTLSRSIIYSGEGLDYQVKFKHYYISER